MAQEILPIPLLPPDYHSGPDVRSGISMAYSGSFNPRGLEKLWYGPFNHTFSQLAFAYQGHLVAYCQYPLWIHAFHIEEQKLRQEFDENDISLDTDHEDYDKPAPDNGDGDDNDHGEEPPSKRRRSERLEKVWKANKANELQKRKDLKAKLWARKAELLQKMGGV